MLWQSSDAKDRFPSLHWNSLSILEVGSRKFDELTSIVPVGPLGLSCSDVVLFNCF